MHSRNQPDSLRATQGAVFHHNRSRAAQGLDALPSKAPRCSSEPQPQSEPPGLTGARDDADPLAEPPPPPPRAIDRVLAQLALDDEDSEGASSDDEDADCDAGEGPDNAAPRHQPGPPAVSGLPLRTDPAAPVPSPMDSDGIAAQHPYYGYASPFPISEPQRRDAVRPPLPICSLVYGSL